MRNEKTGDGSREAEPSLICSAAAKAAQRACPQCCVLSLRKGDAARIANHACKAAVWNFEK